MSRNNDYATGNLLDYFYYQNCFKRFSIDLAKQRNTTVPQQIKFTAKSGEDDSVKMFFINESRRGYLFNFSLDSLIKQNKINNGTSKNIKLIE